MGRDLKTALAAYLTHRLVTEDISVKAFKTLSGVSTGTIDRAKGGDVAISIENLERIANGLKMKPWELLRELELRGKKASPSGSGLSAADDNTVNPIGASQRSLVSVAQSLAGQLTEREARAVTLIITKLAGAKMKGADPHAEGPPDATAPASSYSLQDLPRRGAVVGAQERRHFKKAKHD